MLWCKETSLNGLLRISAVLLAVREFGRMSFLRSTAPTAVAPSNS